MFEEKDSKLEMQTNCIHCGLEHYGPMVYILSTNGGQCSWCGKQIDPLTVKEFRDRMNALREKFRKEKNGS